MRKTKSESQSKGTQNSNTKSDNTETKRMTRQEAGRLGGRATANKHGRDYYRTLGRKGAEVRWGDDQEETKESA